MKRGDRPLEVLDDAVPRLAAREEVGVLTEPEQRRAWSFREYLDLLVEGRWIMAAAVAVVLALAAAYLVAAPRIYVSDALVQVEQKRDGTGLFGDLSTMFEGASPAETEIEILRSRAVLGEIVRQLKLDIVAAPRRFPLVGRAAARRHEGDAVASAPLGLRSFGWGGERITVDRLELPRALVGEALTLVAGDGQGFTVLDADGAVVVAGEVGKAAARDGARIFVSELRARPGLEFRLMLQDHDATVESLQQAISVSEKGRKTGVIRLVLEGEDPRQIAAILDALSVAYVRQNVERKSAEAGKTLEFLESQLPLLRSNLDAAETELESYRSRNGSVDVTLEAQSAVARAVEIEKAASDLKVEYVALRSKFTDDHPALSALSQKLKMLDRERDELDARLKKLPQAELESARRTRDVKVANELYVTLLNRAQELKVIKEGTIGSVRVLDAAVVPSRAVAPRASRILPFALVLGLLLGAAACAVRRALAQGVEDPEAVERATGVGVHAAVPHSPAQVTAERAARQERRAAPLLAERDPKDLAIESLRSLRTSLQFALVEARNTIVAIGGPAPHVGKSFVTANVGHLLGQGGKRVIVVDADLRRGRLHEYYGADRSRGLSDVIAGEIPVHEALRATHSPNVQFIPRGANPPNPAELLGSERFQRLLADLATRCDVVIVDTPPILAVTDAALIARHAGVNLLVIRAGAHPMREITAALRQLGRTGVRVHGIVMNDVRLDRGLGRRNAYHYQYRYE